LSSSPSPFLVVALSYAAITRGFVAAAAIVVVASMSAVGAHLADLGPSHLDRADAVDFVVRSTVAVLAAGGMWIAVGQVRREQTRSRRLAVQRRARVRELEGLHRILARFDGSAPLSETLRSIVDEMRAAFGLRHASIYLLSDDGSLELSGQVACAEPAARIPPSVGVAGRAIRTRRTQFVSDTAADPDHREVDPRVVNVLAVPLVDGDRALGVLTIEGTADRSLTARDIAVAEMIAGAIASAVRVAHETDQRARRHEELTRLDEERRQRLSATERLLAVSRSLASDLDRGRLGGVVVEAARELLAADRASLTASDPTGAFRIEHEVGLGPAVLGRLVVVGHGPAGEALERGVRVVASGDAGETGRAMHTVALPIVIDGAVAAVLSATRLGADRAFTELDLGIADLFAVQAAAAFRNAELHARVAEAALRDPLTGLVNRRYFDEAVESAFANARRSGAGLSLIVLDLDRFSSVNNEHGHPVGDAVLRAAARAMRASVRDGDIVARYGGEEFVVIAPGAGGPTAMAVAERIRAAVAASAAETFEGLEVSLTVSAGVATLLGDELDARELFRAADSALLAAKRGGRDRVVSV
jgi:diguanylate cyclase (GGDEF)-like protein